MNWRKHITSKPDVCHGKMCIEGTRIMVSIILDSLADGVEIETLLKEYPSLKREDIFATLGYAADLASGRYAPRKAG